MLYAYTLQYHPTGVAYPEQIFGALVTEKVRSLGAKLVNVNGEVFMHPLETRDVAAASIIRECSERDNGVNTGNGKGVWLDTPMIEKIGGEGTIMKRIPAMWRMFDKYGIDIRKEPILVYPTLHYQNGGLDIDANCMTTNVENLFVAGEAVGGIHGKNRLMGNSLLDIIVFGRSDTDMVREKTMKALKDFLRPEFIGRVDEIIFFNNLNKESLVKIADILIGELKGPLQDKGINFVIGEGVSEIIAEKSVDGGRGARDIRRNIRKDIEDKIADILIDRAEKETSEINVIAVENKVEVSYKK